MHCCRMLRLLIYSGPKALFLEENHLVEMGADCVGIAVCEYVGKLVVGYVGMLVDDSHGGRKHIKINAK